MTGVATPNERAELSRSSCAPSLRGHVASPESNAWGCGLFDPRGVVPNKPLSERNITYISIPSSGRNRCSYRIDEPRPCTHCHRLLPRTGEFYAPDKRSADDLESRCRDCQRKKALRWAETHRERAKANARKHYRDNRPRYQEAFRSWVKAHPLAAKAHRLVKEALLSGRLLMPDTCDLCGQPGSGTFHHEDYTRPLWGQTLCHKCHRKIHGIFSKQ